MATPPPPPKTPQRLSIIKYDSMPYFAFISELTIGTGCQIKIHSLGCEEALFSHVTPPALAEQKIFKQKILLSILPCYGCPKQKSLILQLLPLNKNSVLHKATGPYMTQGLGLCSPG